MLSPVGVSTENIVVVDSVKEPKKYNNSQSIVKELSTNISVAEQCDLTYNLAQGGKAIHLKEGTDRTSFIEKWPQDLFGGDTVAHPTKGYQNKKVFYSYIKGVPQSLTIPALEDLLNEFGPTGIHRLRHNQSRKALPIVKVTFDSPEKYTAVLESHGIKIPGTNKTAVFAPERGYKVVRCYNCQRYGHTSGCCIHTDRCGNCGEENCSASTCTKPPVCANCSGSHPATSSRCPVFKETAKKLRLQSVLQQQ